MRIVPLVIWACQVNNMHFTKQANYGFPQEIVRDLGSQVNNMHFIAI